MLNMRTVFKSLLNGGDQVLKYFIRMYNDTKILKRILTVGDQEQLHFFFLTPTKSGKSAVFCQKCFERDLLLKYKLFSQTLYCSLSVESLWKASWQWLSMLVFYHYNSTNLEMLTQEQMTELCTFVFAQWPPRSVWLLYAGDEILTKNVCYLLECFQTLQSCSRHAVCAWFGQRM